MNVAQARAQLRATSDTLPRRGKVSLDLQERTARLHIDAPAARNAISVHMMCDLFAAIDQLDTWTGSALVLTAAPGSTFCAGGNLKDVRQALATPSAGLAMSVAMSDVLDRLLSAPFLSIAVVGGHAVGGGAELLTAVDRRVMVSGVQARFVQASLGVATGWGGARRLALHVGRGRALRWLVEQPSMSAEALASWDFAAVVAHPEGAQRYAEAWAAGIAALPAQPVRALKAQVQGGTAGSEQFAGVWGGPAHRRALGLRK